MYPRLLSGDPFRVGVDVIVVIHLSGGTLYPRLLCDDPIRVTNGRLRIVIIIIDKHGATRATGATEGATGATEGATHATEGATHATPLNSLENLGKGR